MPRFHVSGSFVIESRRLFVLARSVLEGAIRPGMSVSVPLNPQLSMAARIHSIEFARQTGGGEDTCLCVLCDEPSELDIWRALNLADEVIEIKGE